MPALAIPQRHRQSLTPGRPQPPNPRAAQVSAASYAIVGSTLYVINDGLLMQGLLPSSMAGQLKPGSLDLAALGIDVPEGRRRLQQAGQQSDLFLVIYNVVASLVVGFLI